MSEVQKTSEAEQSGSTAHTMREAFRKVAAATSDIVGSAWSFIASIVIILVWAVTGPMFQYSDTWQLVINTGTTIITFLMVFLIQNTQNRDSKVIHLKLDELLRAMKHARTNFAQLGHLSDDDLQRYEQEFLELCQREKEERGMRTGNSVADHEADMLEQASHRNTITAGEK
ncbi:MAG: putative small integral rane protein [Chlorobi bacterium]|nr:putative small integral rane protein [Chlorobiota bacterium]